ncbi:hypothetical protein K435DRAFT_967467 [Dendrothele bispora CBS 962.96]|uniref:RING-type E3 ubiquitin transferase n=1 Tax=Dendrothele bispora (strain CBS 962.96) TaxID=1314807 RepID=A0A4S8LTS0_DENBC|nr:hypothetical protein K435DRAFT_967467 [Dendrothele bispora CBS 962.96]
MQEAEEQDTCRICSAPAEPDQPLFHPCKCTGTIRYIHQDCLTTWLAHSKKKTCDLCKHQYAFNKVYASDMPSRLPPVLMVKRLLQQIFHMILLGLRAIAVVFVWLALVPLITVWSWRMYFSMGETAAWWISNRPRPPSGSAISDEYPFNPIVYHLLQYYPPFTNFSTNLFPTLDMHSDNSTVNTVFGRTINHPTWIALSADIFTGQIIASLIVITFVAIFLLREWIAQNARPGVFDDNEDVPAANAPQNQVLQVPPPLAPQAEPQEGVIRFAPEERRREMHARYALRRQQLEAMRALDELRVYDREAREREQERRERREHGVEDDQPIPRAIRNGRSALEFAPVRDEARNEELDRYAVMKQKKRRGKERAGENEFEDDEEDEVLTEQRKRRRNFARRLEQAKSNGARRRVDLAGFPAAPPPAMRSNDSTQGSGNGDLLDASTSSPSTGHNGSPQLPSSSSFFPNVTLQQPTSSIPFSLTPRNSSSSISPSASASSIPGADGNAFLKAVVLLPPLDQIDTPDTSGASANESVASSSTELSSSTLPVTQDIPLPILTPVKRPPLPSTTLPVSNSPTATYPSTPNGVPKTRTPLASPSLATYRPPEELGDLAEDGYFMVGSVPEQEEATVPEVPDVINAVNDVGEDVAENENKEEQERVEDDEETLEDEEDAVLREQEMDRYFAEAGAQRDVGSETEDDEDEDGEENEGDEELRPVEDVLHDDLDGDEEDEDEEDEDEDFDDPEEEGDVIGHEPRLRRIERARERARALALAQGAVAVGDVPNAQAPGPGPLPAPARQDEELLGFADELEGGVEDDMEGAMEAIGMRGPIHGILQNAALMIFVLDTAIGLGIWIPFTIGKCTALLSLDPYRALQILHLPIRAVRLLTDPILDSIVYIIMDLLAPPYIRIARKLFEWWMHSTLFVIASVLGQGRADKAKESCLATYSLVVDLSQRPMEVLGLVPTETKVPPPIVVSSADQSLVTRAFSAAIDIVEPYFAPVGKEVRLSSIRFKDGWTQLALGHGPAERTFSVFLGYLMIAFAIALYLNILTMGNVRTAGKAVRSAVRQQLLVLKVATFIFIELITFPLGCGVVLDLCTIWLFPDATLTSRTVFFYQAPLTALFYHWVAGTMFMYSFAVLLAGCRRIMRSGAMWFIKDPQDQNSHPIRDILDRPTLVQIRKICVSALMYTFVIACSVSSIAGLLAVGSRLILPFRWKTREPLSSIPLDLIFLHITLPYTVSYFRPRKSLKKFATLVWKALAKRLRLSSYFFGGRHPGEEYTPQTWTLRRVLNLGSGTAEDAPTKGDDYDGSFRRVPATDHIALPKDMTATVEVNVDGEPVGDAARRLMNQQDLEAQKAKRNVKDDYMVVYIPPYFRYRIFAFLTLLWICGAVCLGLGVAIPIGIGRGFFNLILKREVHDGYSMIAGFYLLWGCWIAGRAVDRLDKRRQRRGTEGPRAALWWLVVKRGLLWLVKATFMAFFFGIVVPTLIGVAVELYFVLPMKIALKRSSGSLEVDTGVPKLRLVDCWTMGLLYMRIGMKATRIPQTNPLWRGVQHIRQNGWTHPNPIQSTKEVIAPLAFGLLGMIFLPGSVFIGLRALFPVIGTWVTDTFIFTHIYPGIFCMASLGHIFLMSGDLMASWSQSVRDKEFLVEMRLKNHEIEPDVITSSLDLKGKEKEKISVDAETQTDNVDIEKDETEESPEVPTMPATPIKFKGELGPDGQEHRDSLFSKWQMGERLREEAIATNQGSTEPRLPPPGLFDDEEEMEVDETPEVDEIRQLLRERLPENSEKGISEAVAQETDNNRTLPTQDLVLAEGQDEQMERSASSLPTDL